MRFLKLSLLATFLVVAVPLLANYSFEVEDIRVQGLQRVSAGTVFNEISLDVGDVVDSVTTRSLLREIFKMGYFDDVQIARDQNVIEITVQERPSIQSITIDGNSQIKSEDLLEGLRGQGLDKGQIFKQATLDRVRIELQRQYVGQGQYTANIETNIKTLPNNQVDIHIEIEEGKKSGIRQIEFVGNKTYSKTTLVNAMELKEPHLFAFLRGNNKYSRQKLQGDLETLQSFYRDQGFVAFRLTSTQISMTPDRKQVYVTICMNEGEKYVVRNIDVLGDFGDLDPEFLLESVVVATGQVYSSQAVTASEERLTLLFNSRGYSFASVSGVEQIQEDGTVDLLFVIEAGKRAYVRRITFVGNTVTQDSVLRREMRQLEGARASSFAIERSQENLRRLGFFQNVSVETPPVIGSDDQIDVVFSVEERPTGSINGTIGYAQYSGIILQGSFEQANIAGSGNSLGVGLQLSDLERVLKFSYLNPYFTEDGISRALNVNFSDVSYTSIDSRNNFSTSSFGSSAQFGVPIGDRKRLNFSGRVQWTDVTSGYNEATQIADFVDSTGSQFLNYSFQGEWVHLGLNDALVFADRGSRHQVGISFALPGSDLQYSKVAYAGDWFFPLWPGRESSVDDEWAWHFRTRLGYGDVFGDTETYPFFEHFYAGGYGSVRGYERSSLGPRSNPTGVALQYYPQGQPFGGNVVVETSVELYFPIPFLGEVDGARASVFFDAGNVFNTNCTEESTGCFAPDIGELRAAFGIGVIFKAPVGLMGVSISQPINDAPYDDTERITFEILNTTF